MKDLVDLTIGFDAGALTAREYLDFAGELVRTGLVNSTGSYGRFVESLYNGGYLRSDGTLTEHGLNVYNAATEEGDE